MSNDGRPDEQDLDDYKIGAEIGRGSFATVYKGEHVPSGTGVAIKVVSRARLNKRLLENLESEIKIMRTMKHPHIVTLLDYKRTATHSYLAMEYCSLGDLSYFIRYRNKLSSSLPLVASLFERYPSKNGLHEDLARHFLKQLASALQFLREMSLVHRDIKPQNLLLSPPKKTEQEAREAGYAGEWDLPVLKLADFGFARSLTNTGLAETLCGSPLYMAPEILHFEKYGAKADLWSVGAVLYEMLVGRPPFHAANHVDLLKNIVKANDRITFPESNTSSEEIRRLIRSLLKKSPTQRAGYDELFNNPIIRDGTIPENNQLDQSKLDEKIFVSEYIEGVPTTNQLPTPPSRSISISPRAAVIDRTDRQSDHNTPINTANGNVTQQVRQISTSPGQVISDTTTPSPGSSLLVHNEEKPHKLNSHHHHSHNRSPKRDPSPTMSNNQVAIPINKTNNTISNSSFSRHSFREDSLEQGYVVVEKRTVEVNAFADELAYSPTATKSSNSPVRAILHRDRRMSIGYGSSPTNALSKALSMASARLFGTKVDANGTTSSVSPPQFAQRPIPSSIEVEERLLIRELEALATKAKVVNLFAEVKYSQLPPIESDRVISSVVDDEDNIFADRQTGLDPEVTIVVAEEALVLYVKTLSLLTKAMDKAARWWGYTGNKGASVQLIDVVQWIRGKFNESLEKAEYAQSCMEYCYSNDKSKTNRRLQDKPSSNITAEKLIFDRALEMSRAAAVNEQVGEDLEGCELSYGTAVWMLEALLECEKQEEVLGDDDRAIVEKFITSIGHRLSVLRARLEAIGKEGHAQTPALPIHFRRRTSSSSSSSSPSKYSPRTGQITELTSHAIE